MRHAISSRQLRLSSRITARRAAKVPRLRQALLVSMSPRPGKPDGLGHVLQLSQNIKIAGGNDATLVIVRLERRNLVWINVTPHPTAEWIARQITEAFPWAEAPGYLIRDRDRVYGAAVTRRLRAMGIRDKPIAPGSPWQNGFAERLIGSIRRECVDHLIVHGEAHLRRILTKYAAYYNELRTHRSLGKDAPIHRAIQHVGRIASGPVLGGLHHHYSRI